MEREQRELLGKSKISSVCEIIRVEIERLRAIQRIGKALSDCKTNQITLKSGEVAKLILTDRLRSNFAAALGSVGFSETPVAVKLGRGEYGEHPYEVELVARPDVPAGDVLSEGERTCVALAGFLAELETIENRSAIVLDDPISSRDHRYRKRVAERLVREAKERQVIVFTHDIVFLFLLRKYARTLGTPLKEITLHRGGSKGNHGQAEEGPPWVAMSVKQRVGCLRRELQAARSAENSGDQSTYLQKAHWIYDHLRQSWERAVEEVLFNRVVTRFSDGVETQRLKHVTDITDTDVQYIDMEMTRCSGFLHDEAGAMYAGMPGPEIISADIDKLADWVTELRKNRNRN